MSWLFFVSVCLKITARIGSVMAKITNFVAHWTKWHWSEICVCLCPSCFFVSFCLQITPQVGSVVAKLQLASHCSIFVVLRDTRLSGIDAKYVFMSMSSLFLNIVLSQNDASNRKCSGEIANSACILHFSGCFSAKKWPAQTGMCVCIFLRDVCVWGGDISIFRCWPFSSKTFQAWSKLSQFD